MVNFIDIAGLPEVLASLNRLQRGIFNERLMTEVGLLAMARIKKRTLEGRDVEGTPFTPYTHSYRLFRLKTGRPSTNVDLFYTGSMLGAMTFDPDSSAVDVYFMNTQDSSGTENPKKAFFLNESREFFALSEDDIDDIMDIVDQYFTRLIGRQ